MRPLLHDILSESTGSPEDILATFASSDRTYTRGHLRARAQAVGGALLTQGVEHGDRVAVLLENGPEYLEVVFACSMIGAIVVHVHTAAYGHMLERAVGLTQPVCIVINGDAAGRLTAIKVPENMRIITVGDAENAIGTDFTALPRDARLPRVEGRSSLEPICIYSSSGTTGPAKGVTLSHDALFEMARTSQIVMDFGPQDVAYTITPFYHANAIVFMFLAAAVAGSKTVFAERFSVSRFWDDINRYGATRTSLVGSAADLLLSQPEGEADAANTLDLIAAVPRPRTTEAFETRFAVRLTEFYGSTEANLPLGIPSGERQTRTCGRMLPGWQCKIVNSEGDEVPVGTDGELLVRPGSPGVVSSGYWGEPGRTVELWQDLWLHTGDLMRSDEDGWFYYVDRLKDAIRVSGENVASADVEAVVLQHPGVNEAAAFGVASTLGEQDIMVMVVCHEGERLSPQMLREHCESRLPYFAVPRYLEQTDSLPRTPTQRVKKAELRARGVVETTSDLGRPRRPKR